jgi:predicted nucleic-acid-binding Zn-ribbon protein
MRATQTCPKCAGNKFAVTAEFRQPESRSIGARRFVAVILEKKLGRFLGSTTTERGSFESWICLGCGYTEFYAKALDGIEELAKEHPEQLRIVDATWVRHLREQQ